MSVVVASDASASTQVVFVGSAKDDPRFTIDGDSSRTSSAFELTGTLVDDAGAPVANTQLSVNLDPSPAMLVAAESGTQGAAGLPLSVVKTDDNGNFSLPVPALKDIEQYIDIDGTVTLLFMSFDSEQNLLFRQTVHLPKDTGAAALTSLDNEEVFQSKRTIAARVESKAEIVPELKSITLTATRTPAQFTTQAADEAKECARTWGKLGNNLTRDLDVSYDFQRYRLWCTLSGDATRVKDSQVTETRPYKFVGFNRATTNRVLYTCDPAQKGPLGFPLWVSRKDTTTFSAGASGTVSAGISVAGVDVSVKQVNTGEHKKTFSPTEDGAKICGQDGTPVSTEKVIGF